MNTLPTINTPANNVKLAIANYVIGKSPMQDMIRAVHNELKFGIHPTIATQNPGNVTKTTMERYCAVLLREAVKLANIGTFEFTNEGCRADAIFIPDKISSYGLGIQIKTTSCYNTSYKYWRFSGFKKDYSGMLVVLRSLTEGKMWMIPYNLIKRYYTGDMLYLFYSDNSKINWTDFEVTDDNIAATLVEYCKLAQISAMIQLKLIQDLNIPVSINQQKEVRIRQRFSELLLTLDLNIDKPPLEFMSYDLQLGHLHIQEKPARPYKKRLGLKVKLDHYTSNQVYEAHHFDILVIHLPEPFSKYVYFIPSIKLIDRGFLKTATNPGKCMMLVYPPGTRESKYSRPDRWANEYLLDYDDPEIKVKLLYLYNLELEHIMK